MTRSDGEHSLVHFILCPLLNRVKHRGNHTNLFVCNKLVMREVYIAEALLGWDGSGSCYIRKRILKIAATDEMLV